MNTKDAIAKWNVCVFGDWATVISVRKYREVLIDQKPFVDDPDDPELSYRRYRVPCANGDEVFAAMSEFKAVGLQCEISVSVECGGSVAKRLVDCYASTGEGYSKNEGHAAIRFNETEIASVLRGKVNEAINLLQQAID